MKSKQTKNVVNYLPLLSFQPTIFSILETFQFCFRQRDSISVNKPSEIDLEVLEIYNLIIRVTDKGRNPGPLFSTARYRIQINNLNDNKSTFAKSVVDLEYPEKQPLGNLHQLVASDNDKGRSGKVVYTIISGNDDGKFALNQVRKTFATKLFFNARLELAYCLVV